MTTPNLLLRTFGVTQLNAAGSRTYLADCWNSRGCHSTRTLGGAPLGAHSRYIRQFTPSTSDTIIHYALIVFPSTTTISRLFHLRRKHRANGRLLLRMPVGINARHHAFIDLSIVIPSQQASRVVTNRDYPTTIAPPSRVLSSIH